jgi:hypothetical protein
MELKTITMKARLHGLKMLHPAGQENIAIITNLTEHFHVDRLVKVLNELKEDGIVNLIIDYSRFSSSATSTLLPYIDNGLADNGFRVRYFGVNLPTVPLSEDRFRDIWNRSRIQVFSEIYGKKIESNLECAVASFMSGK